METITIPKTEYYQLLTLYQQLTEQLERITHPIVIAENKNDDTDIFQFCGAVKLSKSPLQIQKEMRDEWE